MQFIDVNFQEKEHKDRHFEGRKGGEMNMWEK